MACVLMLMELQLASLRYATLRCAPPVTLLCRMSTKPLIDDPIPSVVKNVGAEADCVEQLKLSEHSQWQHRCRYWRELSNLWLTMEVGCLLIRRAPW